MSGIIHATLVRDVRRSDRYQVDRNSTVRTESGKAIDIRIEDFSAYGCGIATDIWLSEGEIIDIGLPGLGAFHARVIWANARQAGCAFLTPLTPVQIANIDYDKNVVSALFGTNIAPSIRISSHALRRQQRLTRSGKFLFALSISWITVLLAGYMAFAVVS
jgi:hypothetical protein